MAQYYVKNGGSDAANGLSDATAWATVAKVSAGGSAALAAGDIVSFKGGDVWNETLTPARVGASGNPITYNSYGTGRANIRGPLDGSSRRTGGIYFTNMNWVTIDNIQVTSEVANYNGDIYTGIQSDGTSSATKSTHITIINCLISNWHTGINIANHDSFWSVQNTIVQDTGGTGMISGRGATGVAITAGEQTNNDFINNTIQRTGKGTNPGGDGPFHGLYNDSRLSTVRGNTITDFASTGISIRFKSATVESNLIDGTGTTGAGAGRTGDFGIGWFSYEMAANQGTTSFSYNRIKGVGITGIYISRNAGVAQPDTQENFFVVNNSFNMTTTVAGSAYLTVEYTSGFLRIANNSGGTNAFRSIDIQFVPGSWLEKNNNWYNTAGTGQKLRYNGTDYGTIAAWVTASGQGAGDIAANPLYDPDFSTQTGSPNRDAGTTTVTGLTYTGPDATGTVYHYSGTAPDIGAMEFITSKVSSTRQLLYKVNPKVSATRALQYTIKSRSTSSRQLKYNLGGKVTSLRQIKYIVLPLSPPPIPPPLETESTSFADDVYEELLPLQFAESENDFALQKFIRALGRMFQEVEDYGRDTEDGPGWSGVLDVNRAPTKALAWLAQFVGVTVDPNLSDAEQRARLLSTDGWRRGSSASLIGAASLYLTGNKTVIFRERDGDPYRLRVVTYADETPVPSKVEAALNAQKPAGIVLDYRVQLGQDFDQLLTHHPTFANVYSSYITFQGIAEDRPGS